MVLIYSIAIVWPMFHYDSCRTGYTPAKGELDSIKLKWQFVVPDSTGIGFCSPAIGEIYGPVPKKVIKIVVIGAENGFLYVLNGGNGSLLWSYRTGGYIWSSPLLMDINQDDTLEVVFGSNDGKVYALKVKLDRGDLYWSYRTGRGVISSPVAGDIDGDSYPEIIIGSKDSVLYAFRHNGNIKWSFKTDGPIEASPCLGDNTTPVVIGTMRGTLYGLSATGSLIWSFRCAPIQSSPAMADLNNDRILDVVVCDQLGKVYGIDGTTGFPLWTYSTGDRINYASPAIADIDFDNKPEIIVGSFDHLIHCIEGENGTIEWTVNPSIVSFPIPSSVGIADIDSDDTLEIVGGTHEGSLYCLNPDGSLKWRYRDIGDAHSSPALGDIDNDSLIEIVIGSLNYFSVYAFDFPVGVEEQHPHIIKEYEITPNPFYKSTKIKFLLQKQAYVNITIYDILGKKVATLKDEKLNKGIHSINWTIETSGIYFCKINIDNSTFNIKLIKL